MSDYTGMSFGVHKGFTGSMHWHPEVELLFVVEGSIRVSVREQSVELEEDDVLLINSSVMHAMDAGEETLFCLVKYPWRLISELTGGSSKAFVCSSAEDKHRSYAEIRSIFRALTGEYVRQPRRSDCLLDSLLLRLLSELIEHFMVDHSGQSQEKLSDEMRLQQIVQMVNQSYQHNLSLSKIAEELGLSPSTLSRFFKKKTGVSFVDYVNQVRVQSAMRELQSSDENITKIAVNNGFSNLTVFNRVFREINGATPAQFQKASLESREEAERRQRESTEELRQMLQRRGEQSGERLGSAAQLEVRADAREGTAYRKVWGSTINIGSAVQLTQTNIQYHLLHIKEQLGITSARVWNVFAQGLMITDGQRVGKCNFEQLDGVLDFLVNNHISPYLDLGRRPNTITRNEEETVFQVFECIRFASRRAWENTVRSFVRHVVKRYGREEVGKWRFELSYLPGAAEKDQIYRSDGFDNADAFCFLYEVLREYVSEAQVGCGSIMDFRPQAHREMLERCAQRSCPPDFFAISLYPYEAREGAPHPLARRSRDAQWEEKQIAAARALLEECALGECRLFVSEWNISFSNRNFLNDSCYRSACLARKVASIWNSVDLLCLCMGSDWVGYHYDTYRVVNGNMGLLSQFNIRKPVFFALQFLSVLGPYVIQRGEHYILTRTDHASFYALCFNCKKLGNAYYDMDEDEPLPNQLDSLFEEREPLELHLTLEHLTGKRYTVKRRSINEREGSILPEWGRFHYEGDLAYGDVRYLRETCFPRMSMERLLTREGSLRIRERLESNEVVLLHIYEHEG